MHALQAATRPHITTALQPPVSCQMAFICYNVCFFTMANLSLLGTSGFTGEF